MQDQVVLEGHEPVLKKELIEGLNLKEGDKVIDGTLGLGGHAEAVLEKIGLKGMLIGIDLDEKNLKRAKDRLKRFKNFIPVHDNFGNLAEILQELKIDEVDAIYLDLGLSSPHLEETERGFSFLREGPLDMRFDKKLNETAETILNEYSGQKLQRIFWDYGEITKARKLTDLILTERKKGRIDTTLKLAELIKSFTTERDEKKMMMKVFLALRIAVNDELNILKRALEAATNALRKEGRLAVIAYHSLEDRIVKLFFRAGEKECVCPREVLICNCGKRKEWKVLTRKPIVPTKEEVTRNHRSRSAKLRIGRRL